MKISEQIDGRKFREALQRSTLSQKNLAEILKASQSALSRLVNGKQGPRIGFAEKVERALNVPVGSLRS